VAGLLRLLRALPGTPREVRAAVEGVDLDSLVEDAARHGLPVLVEHSLTEAGVELPAAQAQQLRRHSLAVVASGMKSKALLAAALDALAHERIAPILLKGHGLTARFYPQAFDRACTDVDLLVRRIEMDRAAAVLRGLGLVESSELGDVRAKHHPHHRLFASPSGAVELHFRLVGLFGGSLSSEAVFPRSEAFLIEGKPVRYLGVEDELVYLATHATAHLLERLAWLYDLKLFLRKHDPLDLSSVIQVAQASGLSVPTFVALNAARTMLDVNVPERLLEALTPAFWQVELADRLFTEVALEQATLPQRPYLRSVVRALFSSSMPRITVYSMQRIFEHLQRLRGT
jgi:hypothetical protein